MSLPVILRLITNADLAFLRSVYASTRQEEMAATGWAPEAVENFLDMQFTLQHKHYQGHYPGAEFFVIECGGTPAGRLYVHRTTSEIRVIDIALLPERRRRGIGTGLLGDLIRESEAKGLPLTLHVEFNNPVREYYARLGFEQGELRGVYYFMERRPGSAAGKKSFQQGG